MALVPGRCDEVHGMLPVLRYDEGTHHVDCR